MLKLFDQELNALGQQIQALQQQQSELMEKQTKATDAIAQLSELLNLDPIDIHRAIKIVQNAPETVEDQDDPTCMNPEDADEPTPEVEPTPPADVAEVEPVTTIEETKVIEVDRPRPEFKVVDFGAFTALNSDNFYKTEITFNSRARAIKYGKFMARKGWEWELSAANPYILELKTFEFGGEADLKELASMDLRRDPDNQTQPQQLAA